MPTPIAGKATNLTTMMPTISGTCCPSPFKPEKHPVYVPRFSDINLRDKRNS